jgi:phosphate transport system substrate-binding protein
MTIVTTIITIMAANILIAFLQRKEKRQPNQTRRKRYVLNGASIILGIVDAVIIGFFVLIICAFDAHWYNKVCYILLGLLSEAFLVALMAQWITAKRFWIWLGCVVLIAGCLFGSYRYDQYLKDITMHDYFDYMTYAPFTTDSLVKTLDEPATLHFDDINSVPRMDGAVALYPVYAAFAQATYPESMREMDYVSMMKFVGCRNTPGAYRNIVDGTRDIIFVAGPSEEQEKYAEEKGVKLIYTPIGREAFVFFVHPDNPVNGLTLDEIRSIYAGTTTQWKQLGIKHLGDILAYQRNKGSGSQTALERQVMKDTPLMPAQKETQVDGMGGMLEVVSTYKNHKNAIGFSFRFYCTELMKDFDVKLLSINGIAPTIENIENGTYPLASSFYAVTRSDANENTRALLDWITGPQGQALIEKTGYSPVGIPD